MERILKYLNSLKDPSKKFYRILQDKIWVINIYITRVIDLFSYSKVKNHYPLLLRLWVIIEGYDYCHEPCDSEQSF